MRHTIAIALVFIAACSSDPTPDVSDVGGTADVTVPDVRMDDDSTPTDASAPIADMPTDTTVSPDLSASDAALDASIAIDASDSGTPVDMSDPFADRPLGQCTENSECPVGPNGQDCSRALPGGACLGCGNDDHCPTGSSCSQFGACTTDCGADDECPPGLRCLGSGRCAAVSCVGGTCPVALFGCTANNLCERIDCSVDVAACPAQTTCVAGRCIEDRALNR